MKVDLDGLAERIVALPVRQPITAASTSAGNALYYIRLASRDAGPQFFVFDLAAKKETSLGTSTASRSPPTARRCSSRKDGKYGIIDLPKSGPVTISRAAEPLGAWKSTRPPRRVEADLQRMLAADARLLLRPQHARRRLGRGSQEVRAARRARRTTAPI